MSNFTFSATAECDKCGAYLSASDAECDHNGKEVHKRVFRRLFEGRESIIGVEATLDHMWYKLEEKVGDDWIAYQYIGTKSYINRALSKKRWESIESLPIMAMANDAPSDVGET